MGWRHHQKNEAGWAVGSFSSAQPTLFPRFHGTAQLHKQEIKEGTLFNMTPFSLSVLERVSES